MAPVSTPNILYLWVLCFALSTHIFEGDVYRFNTVYIREGIRRRREKEGAGVARGGALQWRIYDLIKGVSRVKYACAKD